MVGISKEDVLNWYQGLNASHRLETICALLDHSLPFELRFLGSVIENLGRKDFHVLRDAECRTNSLHSSEASPDHTAILKLLSEGPAPTSMTLNPQMMNSGIGLFNSHSNSGNEVSSARPSPINTTDQHQKTSDTGKIQLETTKSSENGLPNKSATLPASESYAKGGEQCLSTLTHRTEVNSEEKKEPRQDIWLHDGAKRRKLILYLSLLAATNHDSANLYYILLSRVEDLMESLEWLESSGEMVQDEIQLLYTIGSHHPAFNFEQRTFLSTVLNRFKECINSTNHSSRNFHESPSPPNQILNHHYLPPQHFEGKFGAYYYYAAPPHVQNFQCTQQSPQSGTSSNSEGVRAQTYPLVSYPNFPVFMSPPHPHHPSIHPFQGHPFPTTVMGSSLPVHGSVLQPHPFPQQIPIAPTSSPNAVGHPLIGNKIPLQSSNPSNVHPQSHQGSVSTPMRNPSLPNAVTPFQSQPNSIDGDSEESSENCAWDSPESSPFESPPQSLTPSRSQSPRAAGLHARNTVQVPPTTQCSNVSSPVGVTTSSNISGPGSLHSGTICERLSNSIVAAADHGGAVSSTSSQSATLSKNQSKTTMSDRKGRPYIAGVSSLSNSAQSAFSSTQNLSNNTGISSSTTTPSTSLTVTVSTVPMTNLSPLSNNQSTASQRLGQIQCATVAHSHSSQCMSPPCSSNLASYTNSSSNVCCSGESVHIQNSILSSSSSANIVTSGINSPSSSTVNTSAYGSNNFSPNLSLSSPQNPYSIPLPQHHAVNQTMITAANSYSGETFNTGNPTTMGLLNSINTGYGNPHKGSSMHSQSSQGRMQPKLNTVSNHNQQSGNHLGAQVQHSQQHVMQQLMGQVVGQLPSSVSINNLIGVTTHSISMNTPLLSYGHPSGALNNHGHSNYSAYSSVSYGGMVGQGGPASFRQNPQPPLLNRPAAFMPSHPGSIMNNQMAMKQQHDQRNHTGGISSLRQKNPSAMQNLNTPKRRNSSVSATPSGSNSSVNANMLANNSGSVVSHSQIGKTEETNDIKDRTNNILVVSANPPKSSTQQQDNRGKIYHHPNSGFSNGPVPIGDRVSSGSSSSSNTINSITSNPVPNVAVTSSVAVPPGPILTNSQNKCEENDGGMMEYGVAASSQLPVYHSTGHIYGHHGTSFLPMQNGFLSQSYYPNHVTGQSVGMNNTGAGGPPSTEILMNPGHPQPPYPFTFPFTIPPQNYANSSVASKAVCANNTVAKDCKTPLNITGTKGSSLSNETSKPQGTGNDAGPAAGPPFARTVPPTNTHIATTVGGPVLTNPPSSIQMPSHSPMTAQPARSRGVVLEVGGQLPNTDFPSLSSLENALMPPLEDPIEINCRPRKVSCYNCGSNTHLGPECKEASMEEMTRKQYRLNYGGPSSTESKEGE